MIKRLRIKFVFINMAIVTVMLLVIFCTVFHFARVNLRQQGIRSIGRVADQHRRPEKPGEHPGNMLMPFFIVELGKDGTLEAIKNDYFDLSDEKMVTELLQIVSESPERQGIVDKYQLRFERFAMQNGQRIIFMDISVELAMERNLRKTCIDLVILSFIAFLGISIFLSRWAVRPVELAWEEQKQFVADASHELKTPLTVIMTNAELLTNPQYTDQERNRFAEGILSMSVQMRGLVEGLLELARLDNGAASIEMEPVELTATAEECVMLFEPVYFEKGQILKSELESGLKVRGNRQQLQQVIEILLDNGLKYATGEGEIQIRLRRQGGRCLLTVTSPGERLSEEDLKNIFKRFYRVDKARTMNCSYGLGLSIAYSIVQRHGGKIWAQSSDGINIFSVLLDLEE